MLAIARAFSTSFFRAFRSPPEKGVGWYFGVIRTSRDHNAAGWHRRSTTRTRPTAIVFMASGADLAGIVEQPLPNVLPEGVGPYRRTASTVWISTVRSQRRHENETWRWISERRRGRIWAPVAPARGSFSTDSQYSAGRGSSGAAVGADLRAASSANFSMFFGVGMRQLAGRSVMLN